MNEVQQKNSHFAHSLHSLRVNSCDKQKYKLGSFKKFAEYFLKPKYRLGTF